MEITKATDNKLRYHANVGDAVFELYLHKWRVPSPWPPRILVRIDDDPASVAAVPPARGQTTAAYRDLNETLIARLEKVDEKTKTVKYRPSAKPEDVEIGEPYIPFVMLSTPHPSLLRMEVHWAPETDCGDPTHRCCDPKGAQQARNETRLRLARNL